MHSRAFLSVTDKNRLAVGYANLPASIAMAEREAVLPPMKNNYPGISQLRAVHSDGTRWSD
jgi:hypothetical protein